jgi:hypothetical protein
MKHVDLPGLPPCSMSTQCLRLLDDLDLPTAALSFEQVSSTSAKDTQDERLLEQLNVHIPNCPTCSAVLARARRIRSQQRAVLRDYLIEAEFRVPSTTQQIFTAIEKEQKSPSQSKQKRFGYYLEEIVMPPGVQKQNGNHKLPTDPLSLSRFQRLLGNSLTLATVAALIFAALGIFGHFLIHPSSQKAVVPEGQLPVKGTSSTPAVNASPTTGISPTATATVAPAFDGWNGVVIITRSGAANTLINTYNYLSGDNRSLARTGADMQFDGVSPNGRNMLYQQSSSGHTMYFTLNQLPDRGFFYELNDSNALSAIWMPDSLHVLIATVNQGVIKVDTRTGHSEPFLPSLRTQGVKFYHDSYLYFLGSSEGAIDTLFRINIANGTMQQVTFRSMGADFWLSPDGSMVYFKDGGPAGQFAIYAVNSDGTKNRAIRPDGTPIGFAADNSLVVMREVNGQFQVVQLGSSPQQDKVLMADVAPGAVSLCDPSFEVNAATGAICDTTNIALAPYAHGLIVEASYPDGSRKVWSDDLITSKQFVLLTPANATEVLVPGWDRIPVT